MTERNDVLPSLTDIKDKLPIEVFQSSKLLSLYFVARNFFLIGVLAGLVVYLRDRVPVVALPILFATYALAQGTVMWGSFTIGHDCGHGSFSDSPALNWVVGNVMHGMILTPYEAWRLSHRSHHNNTCCLEKEEIFYPNAPIRKRIATPLFGLAWFLYLLTGNTPGRMSYNTYYFDKRYAARGPALLVSFGTVLAVLALLRYCAQKYGLLAVMQLYGFPVLVFGSWLVVVTFLHHNDEDTPWYTESAWTFVKGNLSSIDRDYGALVNNISHNIHLHQVHHLFPSSVPHYQLAAATSAFRAAFPALVRERVQQPTPVAFWRALLDWVTMGGSAAKPDKQGVYRYKDNKTKKQ